MACLSAVPVGTTEELLVSRFQIIWAILRSVADNQSHLFSQWACSSWKVRLLLCSQEWSWVLPAPVILPLLGAALISLLSPVLLLLSSASFPVLSFLRLEESNLRSVIFKAYCSRMNVCNDLDGLLVWLGYYQAATLHRSSEPKVSCSNSSLQIPPY